MVHELRPNNHRWFESPLFILYLVKTCCILIIIAIFWLCVSYPGSLQLFRQFIQFLSIHLFLIIVFHYVIESIGCLALEGLRLRRWVISILYLYPFELWRIRGGESLRLIHIKANDLLAQGLRSHEFLIRLSIRLRQCAAAWHNLIH